MVYALLDRMEVKGVQLTQSIFMSLLYVCRLPSGSSSGGSVIAAGLEGGRAGTVVGGSADFAGEVDRDDAIDAAAAVAYGNSAFEFSGSFAGGAKPLQRTKSDEVNWERADDLMCRFGLKLPDLTESTFTMVCMTLQKI